MAALRARKVRGRLLLILIGLLVSLVFLEIGFRAYYWAFDKAPSFSDPNDRCLYHVIEELESNRSGWLKETNMYHPMLGWVKRPNVSIEVTETRDDGSLRTFQVTTNSKGVRGEKEYSYERDPSIKRIVVLGDSFAFGDQVNDDETFASVLEKSLLDTEVINLGVSGYGTDQMHIYFMLEGIKYQPDLVLFAIYDGDYLRSAYYCNGYFKPKFWIEGNEVTLRHIPVPKPEEVLEMSNSLLFQSYLLNFVLRYTTSIDRSARDLNHGAKVTKLILEELREEGRKLGFDVFVALLPREGLREVEVYDVLPHMVNFLDGANITSVYLHQGLHEFQQANPDRAIWDGHFTPFGNEVVGEGLSNIIVGAFGWE
jgi:hypothetical protein